MPAAPAPGRSKRSATWRRGFDGALMMKLQHGSLKCECARAADRVSSGQRRRGELRPRDAFTAQLSWTACRRRRCARSIGS
jgi:hypothetical protein